MKILSLKRLCNLNIVIWIRSGRVEIYILELIIKIFFLYYGKGGFCWGEYFGVVLFKVFGS